MHAIYEVGFRSFGVIWERDGWEGLKGKVRLRISGRNVVRFEVRGRRNVGRVMALERDGLRQYVHGKADGAQGKNFHQISTVGTPRTSSGTVVQLKNLTDKDCSIRKAVLFGSRASVGQNSLSGKSTLACVLSRELHSRGKLTYVLDGDNVRHGLNSDLTFKAEDRAENIRRIGEVAKLFSDAGLICIASLISPYRKDRAACRGLLPEGDFIEVFMDVPIQVCERRDPKGLYKLARSGKIKAKTKFMDAAAGFTGIDDPYEPPVNCEIVLKQGQGAVSPCELAEKVISYLDEKCYLHA